MARSFEPVQVTSRHRGARNNDVWCPGEEIPKIKQKHVMTLGKNIRPLGCEGRSHDYYQDLVQDDPRVDRVMGKFAIPG